MANQYTTVQKIRDLIAKENLIANISWTPRGSCFRLVYRWKDGTDRITYVYYDKRLYGGWYGRTEYRRALCWETYKCKALYNTRAEVDGILKESVLADHSFVRDAYDLMRTSVLTYGMRYTRPAYFDGTTGKTLCKYTQNELDSMHGLWKDVK